MAYLLPLGALQNIVRIIRREHPRFYVGRRSLRRIDQDLYALLSAVGAKVGDDEYSVAFREAADTKPSNYAMADVFRKIASADNPLSPEVCSVDALVHLEAAARKRWAANHEVAPNRPYHLIRRAWEELSEWEQSGVREMALKLAHDQKSKIRQGAPTKSNQNALLIGLADVFLRATDDWNTDPLEIPHAVGSRFIRFAHAAASPFFPATEVSTAALSRRWEQWKKSQKRNARKIRPILRQIRKRPNLLK